MRKIILEEADIKDFETLINNLPVFARTISENQIVSQSVNNLMQFMASKIQETKEDKSKN